MLLLNKSNERLKEVLQKVPLYKKMEETFEKRNYFKKKNKMS